MSDANAILLAEGEIIGSSAAMRRVFRQIKLAAPTTATVLIQGQSGTGKELVARALHQLGPRSNRPFVTVNCATLPETLIENELFGHERGAFTGATAARKGYFEAAAGGTLFVDEIGDLTPGLQAKLLRALELKVITHLGSTEERHIDTRIIAATHRDLVEMIAAERFRQDLYYRLSVVRLNLPPLAQRDGDIPLLITHFLREAARTHSRSTPELTAAAQDMLYQYDWPGNVRELHNVIESMIIFSGRPRIGLDQVPAHIREAVERGRRATTANPAAGPASSLAEIERQAILAALDDCGGNRTRAAQRLGIGLRTIQRKLKQYGVE